jgi:hypothetical protein
LLNDQKTAESAPRNLRNHSCRRNYSERQKYVDMEWEVIANEVKQSNEIAASLLLAMTISLSRFL